MEYSNGILRVHAISKKTTALGPGERFALWLQGCEKNCSGCMSPSSRDLNGGTLIAVNDLLRNILTESESGLEGVTISGGEPFLQYHALHDLLKQLRSESDLSVIIYTGYYLDELFEMKIPEIDAVIQQYSDIIIDGPYIESLNDGKSLRGSSNQNIRLTSERYRETAHGIYAQPERKCEIHFNNKEAFLIGIPDENGYKMWRNLFSADASKEFRATENNDAK